MTATTHGAGKTPILAGCQCGDDPQLQMLRDLMNNGMGQLDASRIAFERHPSDRASAAVWSVWIRVEARRIANSLRGQLGLPALSLLEAARHARP